MSRAHVFHVRGCLFLAITIVEANNEPRPCFPWEFWAKLKFLTLVFGAFGVLILHWIPMYLQPSIF